MNDPEPWRWIWLVLAFAFALGEILTPGSFVLLPFAVGATLATVSAFLGAPVAVGWALFVGGSIASLLAFRPLARHLDRQGQANGVGARRLVGQSAMVLREIPGRGELGTVRVGREEWRAESINGGLIPKGVTVRVADVQGTHVVVSASEALRPGDEARR
jgi:membrane protein implicated in regulation of membrane protease activity